MGFPGFSNKFRHDVARTGGPRQAELAAEDILRTVSQKLEKDQKKVGEVKAAGLKKQARSKEKVEKKYGGDIKRLNDVLRASVIFYHKEGLDKARELLGSDGSGLNKKIEGQVKDRFKDREKADKVNSVLKEGSGYMDVQFKVVYGTISFEIQLHVQPLIKAKGEGGGHDLYNIVRTIEAKPKQTWSKKEEEVVKTLNALSRQIYDIAWQAAKADKELTEEEMKKMKELTKEGVAYALARGIKPKKKKKKKEE